ncbi:N2,N2-dimethylguanosine tRNA methyltransferase, partial [Anncaliia algerae PRA339]
MNTNEHEVEGVKLIQSHNAFYNPAQKLNRDLSVLVINTYIEEIKNPKILETMSATGLRGIRYCKEIKNNPQVFLNDISEKSIEEIKINLKLNDIINASVTKNDCINLMNSNKSFYNVIDIDPYGSCNVYVESAFRGIKHNGLLCITATDTAVLCSQRVKCFSRYDTLIVRESSCHEIALRTLLSFVSRCASRNNCSIEPLLSISVDYYVRIFLIVKKSETLAKNTFHNNSYFLICQCFNRREIRMNDSEVNNDCELCHKKMKLCGPFWNKPLHNKEFINKMLKNDLEKRILGFLNIMNSELDTPFYYCLNDLSKQIKCCTPPLRKIVNALLNAHYKVSLTHCKLNSIKTNASLNLIYFLINRYNKKEDLFKDQFKGLEFSFDDNSKTNEVIRDDFYRGLMFSHLGPLKRV